MKVEDKFVIRVLSKLYADCSDIARIEKLCFLNRATERDDYFYSKGAFAACEYIKELILNEKKKFLKKGETHDETND